MNGRSAILLVTVVLVACKSEEPPRETVDAETARAGCTVFRTNCASCHGVAARGDGEHQQHLDPPPANLLSPGSRARTNEELTALVRDGIPGTGMAPYADILSPAEIQQTLAYVDALAAGQQVECEEPADDTAADADSSTGRDGGDAEASTAGDEDGESTAGPTIDPGTTSGPPATGSTTGDDDTTGEVSAACEAWCGCLDMRCSEFGGYPFASVDDCHATCADLTTEEIECWTNFCEQIVGNPGLADHLCDHAWGDLGLNEC